MIEILVFNVSILVTGLVIWQIFRTHGDWDYGEV
jgi:hypothetical protein